MTPNKTISKLFDTPPEGLVVGPVFERRPARIRHDTISRTENENINLQMTNEMFPYRPVRNENVKKHSKITFMLAHKQAWVDRFREMLRKEMLRRFSKPGFGWMDTNHDSHDYKFNLIQCGGNLVNVAALDGGYAYVETQDFYHPPISSWRIGMPHI